MPSTQSHIHTTDSKAQGLAWLVCMTATLFFFYEFLLMNMFNAIAPSIERTFHINAAGLGRLSADYFWADLLFLFPAGLLLDRFSTRKIILSAMGLCIVSTFGFAIANNLHYAAVFRFLSGIGNAFGLLSCVRLAARWFEPKRLALVTGVVITFAMLGGMVAQTPLTLAVEHLGWRHALLMNSFIGIVFLICIFCIVRDYPKSAVCQNTLEKQTLQSIGFWRSIALAIKNKQNWLAGVYTNMMNMPLVLLGAIYGASYLHQAQGLSQEKASWIISTLFLGTIVGSPLMGWLSDKIARRVMPMFVGALLCLGLILILLYWPHLTLIKLASLFFLIGFVSSTQVISYPLVAESNPRALTGTGMGLASLIIMSGYAIFQPVCGMLMDSHWQHRVVDGVPVYSAQDYRFAFLLIPVGFVIGLVSTFFLRETHCQSLIEAHHHTLDKTN